LGEGGTSARVVAKVVVDNRAKELIVVGFLCPRQAYLQLVALKKPWMSKSFVTLCELGQP
jgi:hypothetical protein